MAKIDPEQKPQTDTELNDVDENDRDAESEQPQKGLRTKARVLLVDDEDRFRSSQARQLEIRGYRVFEVDNGEDAIKMVRHKHPHVVVLDLAMPGMDGIETLREIKKIRPEVQVVMLTGHGSIETALVTGKFDVFHYLRKPCPMDELLPALEAARKEYDYALARHEIPNLRKKRDLKGWLIGVHNARPGVMFLGALLFAAMVFLPGPSGLLAMLAAEKTGKPTDVIAGYSDYRRMRSGETIPEHYSKKSDLGNKKSEPDGKVVKEPLTVRQAAFRARVMVGVLLVAALFWATGAIPVGITALLVGGLMYFFDVLPPDKVAKAYAKDSVIFIFGVLSLSAAIAKTGFDRRIGMLLLGTSTSLPKFLFIFAPLLAVTASFLSEHALVAFLAPILILGYAAVIRTAGLKQDRHLVVMLLLLLTFTANIGGPGSPAAGGRNAVMLGILADYGIHVSFAQWLKCGLPFVPVMALVNAAYFFFVFRRKLQVKHFDVAAEVRRESEKIGKMTPQEYRTAFVLVALILLWVTCSQYVGMGGPVILAIVALNILGVLRWKDVNGIHWDVVALYAGASAMGSGLAATGAAVWVANGLVGILPEALKTGEGLAVSASLITGILTNFMSDGATVAAMGPITVPMATLAGVSPLKVGLATAFSSSFAFMFIIGTPNNAICYSIAKDPDTGEQLVTMRDFLVHGTAVLVLSQIVLCGWVFFGYWRFVSF
jgi:solute carrier family 13 (sodium-dependent dicarboxylate transporter), member 2/3/5